MLQNDRMDIFIPNANEVNRKPENYYIKIY